MALVLFGLATVANAQQYSDHVARLEKVILKYFPDATMTRHEQRFDASHHTMEYTIHRQTRDGEVLPRTDRGPGPKANGFVLHFSIADGQYQGPMMGAQYLRKPYWETFLNRPCTAGKQSHYVINFSYGAKLDPAFRGAIFKALPQADCLRK